MGAIINRTQFDKVCGYVEEGLNRSDARLVMGGLPPSSGPLSEGYYAVPTVFADASTTGACRAKRFSVRCWSRSAGTTKRKCSGWPTTTHYGLAAFVWSRDVTRALRAAHAVEAGWVQVNQGIGQILGQSYGGVKQSGIGRECSLEGMLDSFTARKSVTVNLGIPDAPAS